MENVVTKGAKPAEPMQKLSTGGTPPTVEDLGGPTPENYKPDDDSAKLKDAGAVLKQVKDIVNKGAKSAEPMSAGMKKEEAESEGEVVAEEPLLEEEEVVAEEPVASEESEVVAEEEEVEEDVVTETIVNVDEDIEALLQEKNYLKNSKRKQRQSSKLLSDQKLQKLNQNFKSNTKQLL